MALMKRIEGDDSKYLYALISKIEFSKNPLRHITWQSNLQVMVVMKDLEDPEFYEEVGPMNLVIPHARETQKMKYGTASRTDPDTGAPVLDEDGNPIIDQVELGNELVIDDEYQDPLDLSEMRQEGVDISAMGYKWLRETQDFFKDWEDC